DQPIDLAALHGVLDTPRATVWSAVTVGGEEPFDGIWLRLTSTEPGTCRIAATRTAVEAGTCTPAIAIRPPAIVEGRSLSYLALRRTQPQDSAESRWELGATGHGPIGPQLADRLRDHIRTWNQARDVQPHVTAYLGTGSPNQLHDETMIRK